MKSRLQAGRANALKHRSSLDGLLAILKEEGIQGLYKGVGSKLVQSVLTAAILFAGQRRIYEMTKKVCVHIGVRALIPLISRAVFQAIRPLTK
jgi:adenine nucleotide transporter 17